MGYHRSRPAQWNRDYLSSEKDNIEIDWNPEDETARHEYKKSPSDRDNHLGHDVCGLGGNRDGGAP